MDATHAPQKILHAHMQMPVQPGPLTLYYPKWIPGEHMPDGPIINVAGLKFSAGGKTIPWRRDLVGDVRVSSRRSARSERRSTSISIFCFPRRRRAFPRGVGDRVSGRSELEPGAALSAGLSRARSHVRSEPEAAFRLEIRHGAARCASRMATRSISLPFRSTRWLIRR